MTFMRKIYIKILAQDITLLVLSKVEIRLCLAIVSSHPGTMWVVSRRSKKGGLPPICCWAIFPEVEITISAKS